MHQGFDGCFIRNRSFEKKNLLTLGIKLPRFTQQFRSINRKPLIFWPHTLGYFFNGSRQKLNVIASLLITYCSRGPAPQLALPSGPWR